MPSPPELSGVYAKIERANEHIKNIEPALKAFADANTYKVACHYDADAGLLSVYFVEVEPLPLTFSILIGEALHHLRSSLDHLACCLITRAKGVVTKRSGFPIFVKRKEYEASGKSMIKGITARAAAVIEHNQPFWRGAGAADHPLAVLAELNNTDKHRLLLVTRAVLGQGDYNLVLKPPVVIEKGGGHGWVAKAAVENGTPIFQAETAIRNAHVEGKMAIAIAIKEAGTAKNEPAIPLLMQLSGRVVAIVKHLEAEFA